MRNYWHSVPSLTKKAQKVSMLLKEASMIIVLMIWFTVYMKQHLMNNLYVDNNMVIYIYVHTIYTYNGNNIFNHSEYTLDVGEGDVAGRGWGTQKKPSGF